MKTAQLADGTQLQFPDETEDSVIDKVVKQHVTSAKPAEEKPQALSELDKLNNAQHPVYQEPSLLSKFRSAGRAVAGTASDMFSGMLMAPVSGLTEKVLNPESDLESNVANWAQKYSSPPADEKEAEYRQKIAGALEPLNAVAPDLSLAHLASNSRMFNFAPKGKAPVIDPMLQKAKEMKAQEEMKTKEAAPIAEQPLPALEEAPPLIPGSEKLPVQGEAIPEQPLPVLGEPGVPSEVNGLIGAAEAEHPVTTPLEQKVPNESGFLSAETPTEPLQPPSPENASLSDFPLVQKEGWQTGGETSLPIEKTLGGVGKRGFGQGGAFTPFAKKVPSIEQFKADLEKKAGEQFSDSIIGTLYKEKYGEKLTVQKQNQIASSKSISKIPGLKDAVATEFKEPTALDRLATPLSTRALDVNPEFGQRLISHESNTMTKISERLHQVDEFFTGLNIIPEATRNEVNKLLLNNDLEGVRKYVSVSPEVSTAFAKVEKVLADIGKQLKASGVVENLREDYFPRIVKDYKGLLDSVGAERKNALLQKLKDVTDETERSAIINNYLGFRAKGSKPGYSKQRVYDQIPEHLEKFYSSPTESIHSYIRSATNKIEVAKFFGKDLAKDANGKIDLTKSIGNFVNDQLASKKIPNSAAAIEEVYDILHSRFGKGMEGSNPLIQGYKDVATIAVMGDVANTMMQAADIAPVVMQTGVGPTLKSLYMNLKGGMNSARFARAKDLGLMDHAAEEFSGEGGTQRAVRWTLNKSGLSKLDGFMKSVSLTANRLAKEAEVGDMNSRLYRIYEPRFGERFPQLLADLKSGERTPLTDELLFSELSQHQPISKLEYSEVYHNSPNMARPMFTMKSFLLKQLDFIRQNIYREMKKGDYSLATKNAVAFGVTAVAMNVAIQDIRDWIGNKPLTYKQSSDLIWALFSLFNVNKYLSDQAVKDPTKAVLNYISPPTNFLQPVYQDVKSGADAALDKIKGRDVLHNNKNTKFKGESIKLIPVLGDEIYGQTPMGKEKRRELDKKEKQAEKQSHKTSQQLQGIFK